MQEPGWIHSALPFSGLSQTYSSQGSTPALPGFGIYCRDNACQVGEKTAFSKSLCDSSFYRAGVELLQPQSLCVLVITGFYECRMFSHLLDALPGMQRRILYCNC